MELKQEMLGRNNLMDDLTQILKEQFGKHSTEKQMILALQMLMKTDLNMLQLTYVQFLLKKIGELK